MAGGGLLAEGGFEVGEEDAGFAVVDGVGGEFAGDVLAGYSEHLGGGGGFDEDEAIEGAEVGFGAVGEDFGGALDDGLAHLRLDGDG